MNECASKAWGRHFAGSGPISPSRELLLLLLLDLLMTDVPNIVRVAVVAPIGNSDHFSLSAVISMAQAVPNLCE